MPTYEFRCSDCGHHFSVMVSWWQKGKVECPQCHSRKLKQVFSNVNIGRRSDGNCQPRFSGG